MNFWIVQHMQELQLPLVGESNLVCLSGQIQLNSDLLRILLSLLLDRDGGRTLMWGHISVAT